MNIAVICPSEIALRRFLPALAKMTDCRYVGVGVCSAAELVSDGRDSLKTEEVLAAERKKAQAFVTDYGGRIFDSYEEAVTTEEADAVYIPLPPALHFSWAKRALEAGKHVLVEKPATTCEEETRELVRLAGERGLALHENYMYVFHSQLEALESLMQPEQIGDIRLISIRFGFPRRGASDFRYHAALGGGALLDCGGYALGYAARLLGESARVTAASMNTTPEFPVDLFGSATLLNDSGLTAQIAFGMDNDYRCQLEVWGSKGTLTSGRVLTAPAGFVPSAEISRNGKTETVTLPEDDAFLKSIDWFLRCTREPSAREESARRMLRQAGLVETFRRVAGYVPDEV